MAKISPFLTFVCAIIVVLMGILLVSCGETPVSKSIAIVEDATEKVKETNDIYELMGIATQMKSDLDVINTAHSDYKPTEKEAKEIQKALNEFTQVYLQRTYELSGASPEVQQKMKEITEKMLPK